MQRNLLPAALPLIYLDHARHFYFPFLHRVPGFVWAVDYATVPGFVTGQYSYSYQNGVVQSLSFCKNKNSAASQIVTRPTARIAPKICRGQPPTMCSDFVHFWIRWSYSRTREHRFLPHRVFALFASKAFEANNRPNTVSARNCWPTRNSFKV